MALTYRQVILRIARYSVILSFIFASINVNAGRDDAYVHNLTMGNGQIVVSFEEFPAEEVSDETLESWKRTIADWAETTWMDMKRHGFKAPSTETTSDGKPLLRIIVINREGHGGNASQGSPITVKTLGMGSDDARLITRSTLIHEMMHMLQFAYSDTSPGGGDLGRYVNSLSEGTAVLGEELFLEPIFQYRQNHQSSFDNQLKYPGGNLFFRPAGTEQDTVDKTALWWKYLLQAFTNKSGHEAGVDSMARLFNFLEPAAGWRTRSVDRFLAADDFTGDGRSEILAVSDTHIGLLNPVFMRPGTVDIVPKGYRFSGGWRFKPTDRIEASCNLTGDANAEFVIRSSSHIGIIGMGEHGRMQTLAAFNYGVRFGRGWLLKEDDDILGGADLDGDGYCELLIRSNTHIGAIGLTPGGATRTLRVQTLGTRFGNAWLARNSDHLLAIGDMTGDGQDEFVLTSRSHIGVIGYDSTRRQFITAGSRLLRTLGLDAGRSGRNIQAVGIGQLRRGLKPRLVIHDGRSLASVWLSERGALGSTPIVGLGDLGAGFDGTLADVDGDGFTEIIILSRTQGLIIAKSRSTGSVLPVIRSGRRLLNDGFNGNQYRARWRINEDTAIQLAADFDGDGRDDLLLRDNTGLSVVTVTGRRTLRLRMRRNFEHHRFENLQNRLAQFISRESRGTRTLKSMLNDQATANIVSAYWKPGISERYRYLDELIAPGSIDYDNNRASFSVKFAASMNTTRNSEWLNTQLPWSNQYVFLDFAAGALQLHIEQLRKTNVGAYRVVMFNGQDVVDIIQHDGASDTTVNLDYPAGHYGILAIVAHEVPLDYAITLESLDDSM